MKSPRLPIAVLLTGLAAPGLQAALLISGTVTPLGGSFLYEAAVINTDPTDYLIVTVSDAPLGEAVLGLSLTAPPGFQASYDSGSGFLDFVADAGLFAAGATIGVFSFESLTPPNQGFFSAVEALDHTLTSSPGSTQWVLIPEPELVWVVPAFACLAVWLTRRPHDRETPQV